MGFFWGQREHDSISPQSAYHRQRQNRKVDPFDAPKNVCFRVLADKSGLSALSNKAAVYIMRECQVPQ